MVQKNSSCGMQLSHKRWFGGLAWPIAQDRSEWLLSPHLGLLCAEEGFRVLLARGSATPHS